MKGNRYKLKAGYAQGNLNYDLYGVGFADGSAGLKLPLTQTGQIFFVELLRNMGWDIFVGPRFITGNSLITLNSTSGETPPIPPDTGFETNLRSVGVEALRDSRPNRFDPTQGMVFDFTGDFFSEGLGSKYSFQSYKFVSTNTQVSAGNRSLHTTCFCVVREGSLRFRAIVSMARITNYGDTRRGATWIRTCLQHNWNTGWTCAGVQEWLRLGDLAELLQVWAGSEQINFCPERERELDSC